MTFQGFSGLKKRRSDLKLLMCLTGPNEAFSTLLLSFTHFCLSHIFCADARSTDRNRFPLLLKVFHSTLREQFGSSLLLTVAVSGPPTISKAAYDADFIRMNRYVDLVQVMNYDFHIFSYFHPFVGFNAPLRRIRAELGVVGKMNSEASMHTWAEMGLWRNKTIFGIPTYGRGFRLVNWRVNKPYSMATGPVDDITNYPQVATYSLKRRPHSFAGTDKLWLSFEDVRSVKAKANYAKSLEIAGIMVYHIGSDDVYGTCGNGTFPLLTAIKEVLQ
ncbi:unnamed protein product [Heligmosomoides polygyrus]|uniref:Glyco_18 domain-containing protein n=1 Tax=Heligmosomoides polygyrus TaxID=6339 RepID=A0A183GHN8_HELPZ|nr:unnamed protein product [Heligmosomoides polygyrus]